MAIKIKNNTIIDDSRVVVDAYRVGIGTTNPTTNLIIKERSRTEDYDYNNWVVSFASTVSSSGEGPGGVAVDSQGNIYVCGASDQTDTGTFYYKGVLGKFSPSGSLIWQKSITNAGITSGFTALNGVKVDSSDNVYITGYQGNALIPERSIFTAKLNSSGTIQWQAQLGVGNSIAGVSTNNIYSQSIGIGTTGDVFIIGIAATSIGYVDGLVAKYNSSGTLQWQRTVGLGTNLNQRSYGVGVGTTGIVYVGGDAGLSTYRAFVAAFNSSGTLQWQRYIGNSTLGDSNGALGIGVDSSDNVYIAGSENSGTYVGGGDDFWIAKFDKTGTISWQKYIGGDNYEYYPSNIAFDSSNNLYFSGVTYSSSSAYPGTGDLAIFKMNSSGDLQWQRSFGGSGYDDQWWEAPNNTAVYGDKVIVAAYTYSSSDYDISLASLTTDGDFLGNYGPYLKIVETDLTVGVSTWTVGVSTLTVDTSTLNTTAFAIGIETGISTSTLYTRVPDYITPTAEIEGILKVNIINSNPEDGNLGIGTSTPVSKLSVAGTITEYTDGQPWNLVSEYDIGTDANQVPLNQFLGQLAFLDRLPNTTLNTGKFDTGITTSVYVSVTAGIGTNDNTNRDIFVGPGIAYSFPSTVGYEYIIESIHITNKSGADLYLSGRYDFSGGAKVPIANRVIVPYQGSLELLEQPKVASPSDIIRLQALSGIGTDATGQDGGLDAFITLSAKSDLTYVGIGTTVRSTDQEIFVAQNSPVVIQSINLANYNNNVDVDASVSIFRGGTVGQIATTGVRQGYLAYNLTIPKNSTVDICEKPKYLLKGDSILITTTPSNSVGVVVSGKYIV